MRHEEGASKNPAVLAYAPSCLPDPHQFLHLAAALSRVSVW